MSTKINDPNPKIAENPNFNVYGKSWRLLFDRFWMWLLLTTVYNVGGYIIGRLQVPFRALDLGPNANSDPTHYKVS